MRVSALTALFLPSSNYSLPLTVPSQISFFFYVLKFLLSAFLLLFHSLFIRAAQFSHSRMYFCDNPHYCRALSLFSERVPISLYNTLNLCTF